MALAIFDLDNTLIAGDSDHRWGEFACAEGLVDPRGHAEANDRFLRDYQAGTLNIDDYLEFALRPIKGMSLEAVADLQRRFLTDWAEAMILPAAEELLQKHRGRGDTLLIITATNTVVTQPIAERLGVPHLIGCDVEVVNGHYTGRPQGIPSFREGKVQRLAAWLRDRSEQLTDSTFYSDSHNDLPLLETVQTPVAVDPDPDLKAAAMSRGWKVMSLR
ncbi:MAG: HAD family phosphatase [Cellvibrionales bacterium]|jgi:HAD superfamily hydrolase (TIGR01490 family)